MSKVSGAFFLFLVLFPAIFCQGGIFRVNAAQMGGPLNALVTKCDLAFSSPDGRAMFHILPDIIYAHLGIGGGFWQPGSNYQGAVVRQLESAEQSLMSLFQYLHPQATDVQVLKRHALPWEIEALRRASAYSNQLLAQIGGQTMVSQFDAAAMMVKYSEGGDVFQAVLAKSQVNREEIMNDNFLVLTGQEEFVNPHTGEIEVDTDAFRYRWKTDGGDVYYTNREDLDPNHFLQRTDDKRSPVRQRRN